MEQNCCKYYKVVFFFVVFTASFFYSSYSYGQKKVGDSTFSSDTSDADFIDTINHHPAQRAALLSAILPGLGQAYNQKYWKIPVIYAGIAACTYFYIDNRNRQHQFEGYLRDNKYPGQEASVRSGADYYQRNKELNIILLAGLYFLNIIDATVDGYLFDFDVSKDLSFHISPTMMNSSSLGFTCNFRFK